MGTYKAFCYANGVIGFGKRCGNGALPIISDDNLEWLKKEIEVTARHAYDGKTLLVPGVPEAENQMKGIEKLLAYTKWLNERRGKRLQAKAA